MQGAVHEHILAVGHLTPTGASSDVHGSMPSRGMSPLGARGSSAAGAIPGSVVVVSTLSSPLSQKGYGYEYWYEYEYEY